MKKRVLEWLANFASFFLAIASSFLAWIPHVTELPYKWFLINVAALAAAFAFWISAVEE